MIREALEFLFNKGATHQHVGEVVERNPSDPSDWYVIGSNGAVTAKPHPVEPRDQPHPETLEISTLHGVVDFLRRNIDSLDPKLVQVRVATPARVVVEGVIEGWRRRRPVLATATAVLPKLHIAGERLSLEDLKVMLVSGFLPVGQRDQLLQKLNLVTNKSELSVADDGFSASISAKTGVSMETTVEIRNPIDLTPMRAFLDCEQPGSPFILRLYGEEGSVPKAALACADGGAWEIAARAGVAQKLQAYLREAGLDESSVLY